MRTIGSSLLAALLLLAPTASADRKRTAEAYGMIGVTVFREPGFALPGAEIKLAPDPEGVDPATVKKWKGLKGISDERGEFVFRVPTAAMRYSIRAMAKGYLPQQKQVSIEGEQRMDVTFQLAPESK